MAATLDAGREAIVGRVPLARIGEPDDVAGACLFLSSRAGAYVNGSVERIVVEGSTSEAYTDSLTTFPSATIALDGGSLVSANL